MYIQKEAQTITDAGSRQWGKSIILAIIILIALSWWYVVETDKEMRNNLLLQAHIVEKSLNEQHLKGITGTEADLTNPSYLRLKEQLDSLRLANSQYRFLYIMGQKRNGTPFFFVDNEPPTSEDYSAPGEVYEDATPELISLFQGGKGFVEGPETDEWGTWVSALVPIIDKQNGNVLGIVGLDVNAELWRWDVFIRAMHPISLLFLSLVCVVTLMNLSYQKKTEKQLRLANNILKDETIRANDMSEEARKANEAKTDFLTNMSHEIRTPMNGVLGLTSLLAETELSEEQHHYIRLIESSSESLLVIINDILDLSKIEANKLDLEEVDFNIHNLVNDISHIMNFSANEKSLKFMCTTALDVPFNICGDPVRLRQVLINLIGNAIKFTERGKVSLTVDFEKESEEGVYLRFAVRDTGIGISEDKMPMLFEKFSQLSTSTARKYGGTGLGLSISKRLVEMMNGEIAVTSKEGQGSEFAFTARFKKADQKNN